jgi:hypothetical protein
MSATDRQAMVDSGLCYYLPLEFRRGQDLQETVLLDRELGGQGCLIEIVDLLCDVSAGAVRPVVP